MRNREIASIFERIADALEFKGENVFKINAYRKVARVLSDMAKDVEVVWREGRLRDVPGIGEGIAKKIEEFLTTGKMKKYEEAMDGVPEDILSLMDVPSIGPKTLRIAYDKLGVRTSEDFVKVLEDGSLASLPGMGEKKVQNIKKGLEIYERGHERISIGEAYPLIEEIISCLKERFPTAQFTPCGSLRRMKETVGDIDITAGSKEAKKIVDAFISMKFVSEVLGAGATKASVLIPVGKRSLQVDLRVVPLESYGSCIQYFTGSKAHNIHLRILAMKKGLKISEYGVFRDEKKIAGETEEGVYKALGLPWIPPEIREDSGEIEAALEGVLPELIGYSDIKGDLHIHSNYSDGANSIYEIAKKAKEFGYEYICITDHSQKARYAGGLSPSKLAERNKECERVEKEMGLRIFKGIELELTPEGPDYSEEILRELDIVTLAIHQRRAEHDFTNDVISAFPYIHIFAHPTGILISRREEYKIDLKTIFKEAARNDIILEINGYPDRLDLSDINSREAKKYGVKFSICSDAHNKDKLSQIKFGIGIARRGWVEKSDVINALPLEELEKWLAEGRRDV
ncbi:MAG: DNA polymerase/3'-5' exonuclease PolX [candidate division WOR-3 bacterium]|nr:DNA polymerase/3'-5' exonuclease PolX [candidate division WOR-3 bacterium]